MNHRFDNPVCGAWKNAIRITLSAMVCATLLAGCGKNPEIIDDANVRVLNLAPEAGTINVVIDEATTNWQSAIAYQTTSAFKPVTNGSHRVRISNSGGVFLDTTLSMLMRQKQLLVIVGGKSTPAAVFINNDLLTPPAGKTRIRLTSLAIGLATFDFYVTAPTEDYLLISPQASGITSTLHEMNVGTYTVRLTAPGTKVVLFEIPARAFVDRTAYNLAIYNEGSGEIPNAFLIAQADDSAPQLLTSTVSRVRAINSQAANPTVNVNIGSTRVFNNVTFGGVSTFVRTSSGAKAVAFTEALSGTALSSVNDTFAGGRDYSVFLAPNPVGGLPIAFRTTDRIFPAANNKVRVRLVNASTVADLALALSAIAATPSVAVRSASDYVEVAPGIGVPVTITQGAAATPTLSLAGTDLTITKTYTFIVSGVAGALNLKVTQDN